VEVVRGNVVSDVTITSSLRSDVIILGIYFYFLVKLVLRVVHAKNDEVVSIFVKVMQKKAVAFFRTWCITKLTNQD